MASSIGIFGKENVWNKHIIIIITKITTTIITVIIVVIIIIIAIIIMWFYMNSIQTSIYKLHNNLHEFCYWIQKYEYCVFSSCFLEKK